MKLQYLYPISAYFFIFPGMREMLENVFFLKESMVKSFAAIALLPFLLMAPGHFPVSDSRQSWTLTTSDTVAVIAVRGARPVVTFLGSSASSRNWISSPVGEPLPATVTAAGVPAATSWEFADAALEHNSGILTLRFLSASPALELRSIWRAREGHGPVEHWLTITNHSGKAIKIGRQDSLAVQVAVPNDLSTTAWWIRRGGGNATTEGGSFVRSVGRGFDETLVSDPLDGASPVPWLALQVADSEGLYVGWEFSGMGRIHAFTPGDGQERPDSGAARVNFEIGNQPDFETDIEPGEEFLVPSAFIGCYRGDVDHGSYVLHRFIAEKLLPHIPRGYEYPTLAYNLYLDSGGNHADEKSVLRSARLAHDLGFETFVVDAMWFPQSGDWRWDPKRFPNGSLPVERYIHDSGMKLGQWMAYTHGSDSTDPAALNAYAHPEWFAHPPKITHDDDLHWNTRVDLGSDPAREWVERSTQRVISEYKLDFFKTDYSPIETSCERTEHRHHYGSDVSYWSTLGYYEVQQKLLEKFPDLMIEGCSGAGHIKDFGNIQRVHLIAVTDTLSALPDRQAVYDSTYAFPPATLLAYTYENHYDRVSDAPEPYLWRSAMMSGWQIDPTNSANWTPAQLEKVKRSTAIYKSWIRPILRDVEVHHVLPRPDGYHWDGMFYWSPTLRKGTLYIFRPNSRQGQLRVALKGLNSMSTYAVHGEENSTPKTTYKGSQLMTEGLEIKLPAAFTSDLVYVEELDSKAATTEAQSNAQSNN